MQNLLVKVVLKSWVGSKRKQSDITEDCKLYIIFIINDDQGILGVHLLNRKSEDSFLYKIDELDR